MSLSLPDDWADEVDRVAAELGIHRARLLSLVVARWMGRVDERDEIAAIHERMNDLEAKIRRR